MIQVAPNRPDLPNPVPARGGFREPEETTRHVFCQHYSSCLERVVKRDWPNFSCGHCRAYLPLQWTPEDSFLEAEACLRLIEHMLREPSPFLLDFPVTQKHHSQGQGGSDKLLLPVVVGRRLRISVESVRRLVRQGKLRAQRLTERKTLIYESSVVAYLEKKQGW